MYIKIQTSPLSSGNTGSCARLTNYLEKENKQNLKGSKELNHFFSQEKDKVFAHEVILNIDGNNKGLGNRDAKFFSLVIAPSEKELQYIGDSKENLQEYTKLVMQAYAENFNKGLNSQDLVWYAKIEKERKYTGLDIIPEGKKQGDEKEGLQTHIHVIVSRKTVDNKKKISPLANQRGTEITNGLGKFAMGFDRDKFKISCEKIFDERFKYKRPIFETYEYMRATELEKKKLIDQEQYNLSMMKEQIELRKKHEKSQILIQDVHIKS